MCENDCERNEKLSVPDGKALLIFLNEYIKTCAGENEKKGGGSRFPNLAGFCRYCCLGTGELAALKSEYPREYDLMCSALEDEALNSDKSAALVGAYLKNHFGYGDKSADKTRVESGDVRFIFEHDIMADGE